MNGHEQERTDEPSSVDASPRAVPGPPRGSGVRTEPSGGIYNAFVFSMLYGYSQPPCTVSCTTCEWIERDEPSRTWTWTRGRTRGPWTPVDAVDDVDGKQLTQPPVGIVRHTAGGAPRCGSSADRQTE